MKSFVIVILMIYVLLSLALIDDPITRFMSAYSKEEAKRSLHIIIIYIVSIIGILGYIYSIIMS